MNNAQEKADQMRQAQLLNEAYVMIGQWMTRSNGRLVRLCKNGKFRAAIDGDRRMFMAKDIYDFACLLEAVPQ